MALDDTETDNGKNQGENEFYESWENAVANEVTDEIWEAEEDAAPKKESTETLFDDPEDIGEYQWVYDYWSHFDDAWDGDDEWDLPYVDDETFEMLLAAYAEIDFSGEFELGGLELYDEYREKYWQMLQNNGPVMDKETGSMMLLTDFLDGYTSYHFDHYDWNEFDYYFYDVDGNGAPELGIYSFAHFIYLFDYDEGKDQFRVWYEMEGCYYQQVGTRKVMWTTDKNYAFYLLDENGDVVCHTFDFYCVRSGLNSTRFLNIVMMPVYADETKKMAVTQRMKENGIYVRSTRNWYYRLTDEQDEIFADVYHAFNEAYKSAYKKDGEVFYRYEELFGDLMGVK